MSAPVRLLLGPQRPTTNLGEAIAAAGLRPRSVAVISAGWQEAEGDIDDVRELVGVPVNEIGLYGRAEALFAENEALCDAYRQRQDTLKEQQRLYRLRLKQLAIAARNTIRAKGNRAMIAAERRHAIAQLCALDRHHLKRTEAIQQSFEAEFHAGTVADIARHREEIAAILDDNDLVVITGGNIAILINRMRLFGMAELLATRHVCGWSAGAMVLSSRIVLYHDRMPQGRREPEVHGAGLGLLRGHVVLPDPARRLREQDQARVSLMARRYSPDACIALDSGSAVEFRDGRVVAVNAVRRLGRNGRLSALEAA